MRSAVVLCVVLIAGFAATGFARADQVKGRASITSGDTLVVDRTEFRLSGIDAPETDQYCENEFGRPFQCGLQAMDALKELVGRLDVTCLSEGAGEGGLTPATCYAGDLNLNTRMVRTGWAVARTEERPDYEILQTMAKREKAGIWSLKFEDPADWRAANQ